MRDALLRVGELVLLSGTVVAGSSCHTGHPETGVEANPDAGPGACEDISPLAELVFSGELDPVLVRCGERCQNDADCAAQCIARAANADPECVTCLGGVAVCMQRECEDECSGDGRSTACIACRCGENASGVDCTADAVSCIGLRLVSCGSECGAACERVEEGLSAPSSTCSEPVWDDPVSCGDCVTRLEEAFPAETLEDHPELCLDNGAYDVQFFD